MTRERAEALVKELVKQGDLQKKKAQKAVDDILERSRQATDDLRKMIGRELGEQIASLGVATKDDIKGLEKRIDELVAATTAGAATPGPGDPTGG